MSNYRACVTVGPVFHCHAHTPAPPAPTDCPPLPRASDEQSHEYLPFASTTRRSLITARFSTYNQSQRTVSLLFQSLVNRRGGSVELRAVE